MKEEATGRNWRTSMSPYKKPGDDWHGPTFDGIIGVFHSHLMSHSMTVNTERLAEITRQQKGYRRTVNDYHVFAPSDGSGEFAVRLPVVTLGSAGPNADWRTALCWTGPVPEFQIAAALVLLRRDIENHHKEPPAAPETAAPKWQGQGSLQV